MNNAAPSPYTGDARYIFVSYAHRDADRVMPIIERMQADGFRVWFDSGIEPGTNWDDYIAQRVKDCGCFLAFLSRNYLDSSNCRDELNYARDRVEHKLLVYLDTVTLPDGMEMRLGRIQALYWQRFRSPDRFFSVLYAAQALAGLRETEQAGPAQTVHAQPAPAEAVPAKAKKSRCRIFLRYAAALLCFLFLFGTCMITKSNVVLSLIFSIGISVFTFNLWNVHRIYPLHLTKSRGVRVLLRIVFTVLVDLALLSLVILAAVAIGQM